MAFAKPLRHSSRRILVVESNADAGEAVSALLQTWGHQATVVDTGHRAVLRARRDAPEVIILDLGLADMDGCLAVQRIRGAPGGALPVILAYSGSAHREQQTREAGCDAFILKPAVEELEALVQGTREDARAFVERGGPATTRPR
jgi:CheY-like chemotaxis protein